MERSIDKLKEESKKIKNEIRQQTFGYITAGFGLVAGLAWNDAIKTLIEYLFPLSQNGLFAKFIYAIVLTALLVLTSAYVFRTHFSEEKQ